MCGIEEVQPELEKFLIKLISEVSVTETFAKLNNHNVILDLRLNSAIINTTAFIMDEQDEPIASFLNFKITRNTPNTEWTALENNIDLKPYLSILKNKSE